MSLPLIILALIVLAAGWAVMTYNRFVTLTTRIQEAWTDIDVQLKRRYDLIPNLVETVKGYAAHESGTLSQVTEMRTRAMNATTPEAKASAENMLSGTLKSLFAVSENYPQLKANENFLELQRELSDYRRGDMVVFKESFGGHAALITGVTSRPSYPYDAIVFGKAKGYKLSGHEIERKLAAVAEDDPLLAGSKPVAQDAAAVAAAMKYLRSLKPGDSISLRTHGRLQAGTFGRVLEGGKKFAFTATKRGGATMYKWTLDALVVPEAAAAATA